MGGKRGHFFPSQDICTRHLCAVSQDPSRGELKRDERVLWHSRAGSSRPHLCWHCQHVSCGKVFSPSLASQPPLVLHWLVIHSGGKPLGAGVQIPEVGLHRPPVLPRQLLTELLILHIRKLKKWGSEALRRKHRESQPWIQECCGANQSVALCLPSRKGSRDRYRDEDNMQKPNAAKYYSPTATPQAHQRAQSFLPPSLFRRPVTSYPSSKS